METDDEKLKDTQSKNYELQMWKEENQVLQGENSTNIFLLEPFPIQIDQSLQN